MERALGRYKYFLILFLAAISLFLVGDKALPENAALEDEAVKSETLSVERSEADYEIDGRIVMVKAGDRGRHILAASGSGVVYDISEDSLWIVTAGHVLGHADGYEVWVDFGSTADRGAKTADNNAEVICGAYEMAKDADLAFLRLPLETIPEDIRSQLEKPLTDKDRYDGLSASAVVYVWGYGDDKLFFYEGILTDAWIYVEDFDQYMLVADCEIEPGMSGGGLYDAEDNLIGIACGGNEAGELAAVPFHVVQARFADIAK